MSASWQYRARTINKKNYETDLIYDPSDLFWATKGGNEQPDEEKR
jgi:hypothetical protein